MQRFLTVSVGVLVLSAGLFLVGPVGVQAATANQNPGQPFDQILTMLAQLQAAVSSLQSQVNNLSTSVDLSGVTQNWDKNLPSASRFTVLAAFNNQAVRDNNTGLVWEQAPSGTPRAWEAAVDHCANKAPGGTTGWRLPSVFELNSVRDPSLAPPFVPAVFSGVQSANYWSATTVTSNPDAAWDVRFLNGLVSRSSKGGQLLCWCVRGHMNADQY